MPKKSLPWTLAVVVGYLLLLGATFYFVPAPWNWLVGAFIAIKAAMFLWAMRRAATLGPSRREPPPGPADLHDLGRDSR